MRTAILLIAFAVVIAALVWPRKVGQQTLLVTFADGSRQDVPVWPEQRWSIDTKGYGSDSLRVGTYDIGTGHGNTPIPPEQFTWEQKGRVTP